MDFGYRNQTEYLAALGVDPESTDGETITQLFDRLRANAERMDAAAKWIRSALDETRVMFDAPAGPGGIHTVGVRPGNVGRHAVDYEAAAGAYQALQDQLAGVVVRIRQARGEDVGVFGARLEDVGPAADLRALIAAGDPAVASPPAVADGLGGWVPAS
jgi:hypothetical protein